jgi:hypothetical protein
MHLLPHPKMVHLLRPLVVNLHQGHLPHLDQGLAIIYTVHLHRAVNRKVVGNNLNLAKLKQQAIIKPVLV